MSAVFQSSFSSEFEPWAVVEKGDHIPYVPGLQISLSSGFETDRFDLEVSLSYLDEMRTVAGSGRVDTSERTDARIVLDASSGYSVSSQIRLFATVRNVTDEVYVVARRPAGLRPGLPRTLLLGIKTTF